MRKKIFITIGTLAVCAYVVFVISAFSYKSDKQACNNVEVVIKDSAQLRFISKKEIMLLLEEKKLKPIGISMQTVDIENIEKTTAHQECGVL